MSNYTNVNIYFVLKAGKTLPPTVILPEPGEGRISGKTADGRTFFRSCFFGPDTLRALVHAEDSGDLDIKTTAEMRALMPEVVE